MSSQPHRSQETHTLKRLRFESAERRDFQSMSNNGTTIYDNLFSLLISDIKSYNGNDPLLPWLRGIRKMKETLPPQLLNEKLPRFLQKCAETFISDRRYSNDLRYLRVWLQLMDFVEDAKALLKTMEKNRIGIKKSIFYQAYALYYEKLKKFDAAEKIFHTGVQNLAEPADELQKSYEQFLHRMERHKNKKAQAQKLKRGPLKSNDDRCEMPTKEAGRSQMEILEDQLINKAVVSDSGFKADENGKRCVSDDTIVKVVDTAIVGNANTEDAQHHGKQPKSNNTSENGFKIFSDERLANQPQNELFEIFVDDSEETDDEAKDKLPEKRVPGQYPCVFAKPNDNSPECSKPMNPRKAQQALLREDTVVSRFVGSTILDEPKVENVWHHGLVEPTINLKEAMKDINSMFGKPIEYVRKSRSRKQEKHPEVNNNGEGFLILPDDEPETQNREQNFGVKNATMNQDKVADTMINNFLILPDDEVDSQEGQSKSGLPPARDGNDLFEQTVCTKEAMAEISKLFSMPMDF